MIKQRESCRTYLEKGVEREKLQACAEAVRQAPSACNSQPWKMILVDETPLVQALAPLLQDGIIAVNRFAPQVPAYIVLVEGDANLSCKLGGRFKDQDFAEMDMGIAAAYITLAAAEQGLGSCIMGWFDEKAVKELLDIPKKRRIRLIVALGYPKHPIARPKARKDMIELLSFQKWEGEEK